MVKPLPRILLAVAALILAAGGVVHAMAFAKAQTVLDAVIIPPFYAGSFKALWLIDSAALIGLAILFALIAARPAVATRWIVLLLALIPAATAGLVYYFVGPIFPPHALVLVVALVIIAGMQFPQSRS